jgi:hypothetical protein
VSETPNVLLVDLEKAAEAACQAAYRKRKTIDGPINWGDLHCVSVERYTELYRGVPDAGYRVYVEEAAPESYELARFIGDHLAKHGFPNIDVRTEW